MQRPVLPGKVPRNARKGMVVVRLQVTARVSLLVALFACWLMPSALHATPKVACEIKEVARHQSLVTFSWHVTIDSDKVREGCDLKVSFRDNKGEELYLVSDSVALKVGRSIFSGTEVCPLESWKRVVKYVTTLDCVF